MAIQRAVRHSFPRRLVGPAHVRRHGLDAVVLRAVEDNLHAHGAQGITCPTSLDQRTPMRPTLPVAALFLLAVAPVAAAQETSTERSAAADVIRRMNELERSLALPQLVARLTGRDPRRDAVAARAK